MMAAIELISLVKRYGVGTKAVQVLHNVSAEIHDGEFVVIVGPSGCGKSTLLRMVAGLEDITEGEIRIGSNRVNELEPSKRDIAMVFQNYALYPHMSVFDNMAYGLKIAKVSGFIALIFNKSSKRRSALFTFEKTIASLATLWLYSPNNIKLFA
jgi:sn-glycerol 3-phosphate transport system ATP-binding protein